MWIKFSLFRAAVLNKEFVQLEAKYHNYRIRILKKAIVASVVVLHRHLFQENNSQATKISIIVSNSLVKALRGYQLNARLHVTAKLEKEMAKQLQSSSSLCSRNSIGHLASFVLTRQTYRALGGESQPDFAVLCFVTATSYSVYSSETLKSVSESLGNCGRTQRHPLLTREMGRLIRTYCIILGTSLLRKNG